MLSKTPLRLILVVPFVAQITVAVGLTAWLSIRNGQQAVNDVANQLRRETTARVNAEIDDLLSTTRAVNDLSVKAIQRENLDLSNIRSVEATYWDYLSTFPKILGIGIGNTAGDLLGIFRRIENGETRNFLEYSNLETRGKYVSAQLDQQGQVIQSEIIDRQIDARERPWYQAAIEAAGPVWTEVYTSVSQVEGHALAINASRPTYRSDGQLQGVASVILDLGQISQLLETIEMSPSGQIYILEANGNLIGSSDGNNPVSVDENRVDRLQAIDSKNLLIRESAIYLNSLLGNNFGSINQALQLEFRLRGERQYLQITPIRASTQLQWLIVVVAPESDFMGQIETNTRNTIFLCIVSLALATGSSILTAHWVTVPLQRLNQATKDIAQGNLQFENRSGAIATVRPLEVLEVNELAQSFSQMAQQLHDSFAALQTSEANFRNMAANVPGAMFRYVLRPDGTDAFLYMSPSCYQLWEVEANVVEQNPYILWETVDPEDLPTMRTSVIKSAQTLELWCQEWRITTPSGYGKWLQGIGRPTRQADGAVLWHTLVLDVSDRKAAEQALKVQRDFNELIATITSRFVDLSPTNLDNEIQQALRDICEVTAADTGFIFQFDEAAQTLSLTYEWGQQDACSCSSPLSDDIPFAAFPWSISKLKQREVIQAYYINDIPDAIDRASWRQFNLTAVLAFPLIQKSVVTGFMGFGSCSKPIIWGGDILRLIKVMGQTIAKAQEGAWAEAALTESEKRFRNMANHAPVFIWVSNADGKYTFCNQTWLEFTGLEPGQTLEDICMKHLHPGDSQRSLEAYRTALKQQHPLQIEYRLRRSDGEYRWILDQGTPRFNPDGEFVGFIGSCIDIHDRKQAEEQLIHSAFHDALTDLPNRTFLTSRLESAIQRTRRSSRYHFAVLFLDLDQFKLINDSLGHLIGDKLLLMVAQKLQATIRPTDLAARLGGDEFVILVEDVPDIQSVTHMADRLLAEIDGTTVIDDHNIFITTSMGIVWGSTGYTEAANLLRDADIALYRAKAKGRRRYEIFDAEMHVQAVKRMRLEHDLRVAIDQQEFLTYFQPIVDLNTQRIMGFEALIRWQHPTQGFISPADFIPVAEETGMITLIGQWMLQSACGQVATWQRQFPDMEDLRVSVNLSGQDLQQPTLVEMVRQTLSQTQLRAASLTLEITESMLIDNIETTIELLGKLQALNIRVSIDDFGTGYSSLSYLYSLPADYLKIDQSFVGNMKLGDKNSKIVQAVVSLSDQLQIAAIAEGIETEQQLAWLRELGCELGQGYLLAPPLTPEATTNLLAMGRTLQRSITS